MKLFKLKMVGYTLIEILLVLIIISILATVGILVFQQRSTEAKVQTTATQIQQLMQAASAYYVDNTCWPESNSCPQNVLDFKQNYLTMSVNNPWGGQYTFTVEPTYEKKFQVFSGNLPPSILPRVLALLPNAAIDPNNPQQILAEIAVPAKTANQPIVQGITIQALGLTGDLCDHEYGKSCTSSYSFQMSCPGFPWMAKAVAAPYHTHANDDNSYPGGSYLISALDGGTDASTACTQISTHGSEITYQCTIVATAQSKTGAGIPPRSTHVLGTVNYMYIGYCVNLEKPITRFKNIKLF